MRRRGFTIVELLVVISVIGLLLVISLPAVMNAREAMARSTCENNLRQIGLALHEYHDVEGKLPPSFFLSRACENGEPGSPPRPQCHGHWGWIVAILPQLDQGPLYARLNPQGEDHIFYHYYHRHGRIIPGGDTVLKVLRCPSSPLPSHVMEMGPGKIHEMVLGYATTDYRANGWNPAALRSPFSHGSARFDEIRDGLSQTILVGESTYPGRGGNRFPMWVGGWNTSDVELSVDPVIPINCVPSFGGRFWINATDDYCALSLHPGIAQFAFCDARVHALNENMDRAVYGALGSINGHEAIDMNF